MYKTSKRIFDLILGMIVLLIILPLMLPIVIGLKLTGEGYIWYFQKRIGLNNQPFQIWKFATMLLNSPNMSGGIITTKNDPRITPMGGFLRKTKINEFPQLINVLRGEMSFVGPRPVMPQSFAEYPDHVKDVIYNVPPGITGIGSIVFRDEEDIILKATEEGKTAWDVYTKEIYPYKGELEKWYQQNQSFGLDLLILFCTAWVIIFPSSNLIFRLYPDLPVRSIGSTPSS